MEGVIFAVVAVIYVIGWLYRLLTAATAAVRKSFGLPPAAAAVPKTTPTAPTLGTAPARPDLRRPELWQRKNPATPAVTREATTQEFREETQELFAAEPSALNEVLASPSEQTPAVPTLASGSRDLLRAFIWQEVLAPPLSKRK